MEKILHIIHVSKFLLCAFFWPRKKKLLVAWKDFTMSSHVVEKKLLNFTYLFRCKKMLPAEVWAVVLTCLKYSDLLNLAACWKMFYFLSRNDKNFLYCLSLSRSIVSNKDLFDQYRDLWLSFISKLSVRLKGRKVFSHILFDAIHFRVYNHLFDCCRKYYDNENSFILCKRFCIQERALSELLNEMFFFCSDNFPEVITENYKRHVSLHVPSPFFCFKFQT